MDTRNDLKISTCGLCSLSRDDVAVLVDARLGVADWGGTMVFEEEGLEDVEPPDSGGSGWRDRSGGEVYAVFHVSRTPSPVSLRGNGRDVGPPLFGAVVL